jgi:tetratricopeptide (TPR) repeat protein
MSEKLENLSRDLSDAESLGKVEKIAEVCRRALDTLSVQSAPEEIFRFGIKLTAILLAGEEPIRPADVEEGIRVLQKLLAFVSRENNPRQWAHIHVQLGAAFFREEQTLRAAISHFENALLILRKDRSPKEWALTKVAAGQAYWWLGDKSERAVAIAYLEEALTVYTRKKFPAEYRDYVEQLASWKKR